MRGHGIVCRWVAPMLLLALAVPASAQISTGVIEVETRDADALALPGVTVRVLNTETGAGRNAISNETGAATFPALPPGTYRVEANLDGFAPVIQDEVVLRIGQTVRLVMTLRGQVSETITVTAEAPIVDVYKVDSSTNVVPEQIEALPVQDREFEKLAFITPGVQRERGAFRFIGGGPVIGAGGNASQASILVDGVEFTDQALGLSRARFSQDAIREFRVVSSRFDSEIGGSAGGALSVVTKSGTNEIHGSVFGFYRDDSMRSTGELETGEQDFQRYQVGATIGGPIVPDRTHYFLSLEYIDEEDIAPFRPGGAFADQATDYPNPKERTLGLLSLNHQFNPSISGMAKLVYERYREENFRVGGVADLSNGQQLNRDNWNLTLGNTWVLGDGSRLNEARFQIGSRDYDEPTNSGEPEEWFSGGTTLRIGNNTVGDLIGEGDYFELRDTFHWQVGSHDLKAGASWFNVAERSVIDTFQEGLFLWAFDDRSFLAAYIYGVGSSDVDVDTDIYSVFVHDDWRATPNFTLSFGMRYDYDTDGNNPDFVHPLTGRRSVDANNFQPRAGFSWDLSGDGRSVLRGGAGLFAGRYLLVPQFTEEQQNGVTGRVTRTNVALPQFGIFIDPNDPENTGFALNPDITLMEDSLRTPESLQASLGFTQRLGDTGLYADLEGVWVEGHNEIVIRDQNFGGNQNPVRLNPSYNQINVYSNEGHSEYKAVVLSVNGTFGDAGHLVTASATYSDKKNIADDFSPAFPTGYPSDPANIEGEFGRSRSDEEFRVVISGVFFAPWDITVAPILEYGTGQPWNHILGYDFNGDGKNSDRPAGVDRNSMDGPEFKSVSLRLSKAFRIGDAGELEVIVEGFNLFDWTNYDVTSVDNAEFFSGPTLANPTAAYVNNPNFGNYRATLNPREVQLGLRYRF